MVAVGLERAGDLIPIHRQRRVHPPHAADQPVSIRPDDESLVQRRYLSVESMALILSAGWSGDPSLEQQHSQEVAELTPA